MDANNGNETTTTTESTTTTAPAAPARPSKAELRAAELKAKREAKEAAKIARKAELASKRADGIIGTLKAALDTPTGTSRKEILAVLTAKFPDRDPIGMAVTVGIQLSRLQKTTGRKIVSAKVKSRERVYGFEGVVQFPAATPSQAAENAVVEALKADAAAPTTTNETLSNIGSAIVANKTSAAPEPKTAPALTVSKGGNKGGGKGKKR